MIRFGADENFNYNIVRGVRRRDPAVQIVCVQDVGLFGAGDPRVLEWAAAEGRIMLSHDVSTLTRFAYDRVAAGLRMPGVFEVGRRLTIKAVIDDLLLVSHCSFPDDWEGRVVYLPI